MAFILNLNENEEELIEILNGDSKKILFAGIAELLTSAPKGEEDWDSLAKPGVVCFVRDLVKKTFLLQIINMKKGKVVWSQNIDIHVNTQRRRRWIFVFQTSFRKVLLNFVDDNEADGFSMVLAKHFPRAQEAERNANVMPYTITEDGHVVRNTRPIISNEKKELNVKNLVKMVGLPEEVLNDPNIGQTITEIYEEYGSDLEQDLDVLEETYGSDYGDAEIFDEIYEDDDEEDYGDCDSPLLPENTSHSTCSKKRETWSTGPDLMLSVQETSKPRIISDPTPVPPPKSQLPPPPPPITAQSLRHNNSTISIKRPSIKKLKPRESLQDQIKNPGFKLRSVNRSSQKCTDRENSARPCLSDALMGAMNKIRMATIAGELYGVVDETKIYDRDDDW